jgi:hypothetical protein
MIHGPSFPGRSGDFSMLCYCCVHAFLIVRVPKVNIAGIPRAHLSAACLRVTCTRKPGVETCKPEDEGIGWQSAAWQQPMHSIPQGTT